MPRPVNFRGRSRLLQQALFIFGGAGLGRKIGISRQRVNQWTDVPVSRRAAIRQLIRQSNDLRERKHQDSI